MLWPSSSCARIAVLAIASHLIDDVQRTYSALGFDRTGLDRWLAEVAHLPRTVWIHETVHRYVFERYVLGEVDNRATWFLEEEIVKELFYLFRAEEEGEQRATVQRKHGPTVERALQYLEEHLLERSNVAALANAIGASESTLLRAFRRELGASPSQYWKGRKLDAALDLLRSGRHGVGEVAELVGYENTTPFSNAFRARFGRKPSRFRPK